MDVHQEASPALSTWGPGIAYSRLMRFKSGPNVELPSLAVECDLCESWTLLDDKTFEFKLRDNVRWHDIGPVNGRNLTAEDIVFSYNRQRQSGFPNAPLLQFIESITTPDPATVRISLSFPDADFLIALADGRSKIIAREVPELHGDLKNGPTIGTGPWILTDSDLSGGFRFESNPDYFESGAPFANELRIQVVPDDATREVAFRVKAIDVLQVEPPAWARIRDALPGLSFAMLPEAGTGTEIALNTGRFPFDDVNVRRAVFQAIDPWKANEDIWLGAAYVGLGLPPVNADWLLPEQELRNYFGSPQTARDMLRNAGAAPPLPITIKVGDFGESVQAYAERVAEELKSVGFSPTLELVNRRSFGEDVWLGGAYQMFVGPIAPVTSPNGYLIPILHSEGRWNTTGYANSGLDALIETQAVESDATRRADMVQEIQRMALEGAHRFMPAGRASIWTWQKRVQNFHPNFSGFEYLHWTQVWLEN